MPNNASSFAASQKLLEHIRQSDAPASLPEPAPSAAPGEKNAFKRRDAVIGIDLRPDSVTLTRCLNAAVPQLSHIRVFPLPANATEAVRIAKLRASLNDFAPDLSRCRIWMHLPEQAAELHSLRVSKVKATELDALVTLAVRKEKKFDAAETVLDYRTLNEVQEHGTGKLNVLAMTASKESVVKTQATLRHAGIHLDGLTAADARFTNLFASGWLKTPWERFGFVNIDDDVTTILVFDGNVARLKRTLRSGGQALQLAMAEFKPQTGVPGESAHTSANNPFFADGDAPVYAIDTPLHDAMQAKTDWTMPEEDTPAIEADVSLPARMAPRSNALWLGPADEKEKEVLQNALPGTLRRIVRQVEWTLNHYRNTIDNRGVQGVVLLGPEGALEMTMQILKDSIGLACLPLRFDGPSSPGAKFELDQLLRKKGVLAVTTSLGLALSGNTTPNALMTYKDRRLSKEHRLTSALALAAAGLALAGILVLTFHFWSLWRINSAEAAKLTAERGALKEILSANILKNEINSLEAMHAKGERLLQRRIAASILSELSSIVPETVRITEMRCTFPSVTGQEKNRTPSNNNVPPPKKTGSENLVVIKGLAYGDMMQRETHLAEMINRLEQSPVIVSVSIQKMPASNNAIAFIATLKVV